ncbi:uncharacterized protein LOC124815020 [Hydra vulgaris]|uniref:uncharacterized protein LOC124815020 n=1 Tax=Hydra vulgaris TaxID=6087 RepID=UPI001F5FDA5E|nr:uncharacterized protein LOC124815020 [Hydra vulgaris]
MSIQFELVDAIHKYALESVANKAQKWVKHQSGSSTRKVQLILKNLLQSCVTKTLAKWKKTGSTLDKIRYRRPRKTTNTDENSIYKIARKNTKYSAKQIAQEINLALKNDISRQTVYRRLFDRNLCSYTTARKLMPKRLDFFKRL